MDRVDGGLVFTDLVESESRSPALSDLLVDGGTFAVVDVGRSDAFRRRRSGRQRAAAALLSDDRPAGIVSMRAPTRRRPHLRHAISRGTAARSGSLPPRSADQTAPARLQPTSQRTARAG